MSQRSQVRYRPPRAVVAAIVLGYVQAGLLFAAGVWLVVNLSWTIRDHGLPWGIAGVIAVTPFLLSFGFVGVTDRFRAGQSRLGLLVHSSVVGVMLLLMFINSANLLIGIALLIPAMTIFLLIAPTTIEWNSRPQSPLWRVRARRRRRESGESHRGQVPGAGR